MLKNILKNNEYFHGYYEIDFELMDQKMQFNFS